MIVDLCEFELEFDLLQLLLVVGRVWVEFIVGILVGVEWRIKGGFKVYKEVDRSRE